MEQNIHLYKLEWSGPLHADNNLTFYFKEPSQCAQFLENVLPYSTIKITPIITTKGSKEHNESCHWHAIARQHASRQP